FHRIRIDIARDVAQPLRREYATRPVAVLKQMPDPSVTLVEALRVERVDPLHAKPKVGLERPNQKVDVVRHQAVLETVPAPLADDITEQLQIPLTIKVVHKNHASIDTACIDVVNSAGLFTSRFPWHVQRSRVSEKLAPASRGQTPFTDVGFTCEGGLTPSC